MTSSCDHQLQQSQDHPMTWWSTIQLPLSRTPVTTVFLLFEYFSQNAQLYANLRVSASSSLPNSLPHDRAFSTDQLFTSFSSLSSTDPSKPLRHYLDNFNDRHTNSNNDNQNVSNTINITEQQDGHSITVTIALHQHSPIVLCLSNKLSKSKFLDRVMRYSTFVNHTLSDLQQDIDESNTQREQLVTALNSSIQSKIDYQTKLRKGTAVLMEEKRKHQSSSSLGV